MIVNFFIILVVFHFASIALGDEVAIDERCDQTVPHPVQCKNLMIQHPTHSPITSTTQFVSKGMKRNENEFGVSKALPIESPSTNGGRVDVVVAKDGSGDYKTIQEAIDGAGIKRTNRSRRYVIRVKQGTYEEYVIVGSKSKNLMIIGEGMGKTIITGDRSNGTGFRTNDSATFVAKGDGLVLKNMTIRNTAGPENKQAVALLSYSDASAFHRCRIEGFQDTLYVSASRQFFKECEIYGTVDFIFGDAAVIFQDCKIFALRPPGGVNTITAQSRASKNQTGGIVIHNRYGSEVKEAPGVWLGGVKTYLGRPWRAYARTVVIKTQLGQLIEPEGWLQWGASTDFRSMYYAEYRNSGPGSGTENRVKWPGFHAISDEKEARQFTVGNFIDGASWLPETGVPFSVDL